MRHFSSKQKRHPDSFSTDRQRMPVRRLWFVVAAIGAASLTSQTLASPSVLGEWSSVIEWPHVPVSVATLESGEILTWASNEKLAFPDNGIRYTHSTIWDPVSSQFTTVDNPSHDMFCSGISTRSDGTIVAAGGNPQLQDTSIFNPSTREWSTGPAMNRERWYGSHLTQADDTIVATYARGDSNIPEILKPGGWTELPGALMTTLFNESAAVAAATVTWSVGPQWYANIQVAPDGRIFHAGPTRTMHWMTTDGDGTLEPIGQRLSGDQHRQGNTFSMYDVGQLLMTGGSDTSIDPSAANSAITFDINASSPNVSATGSMNARRVYHNAVVLPNGEVVIIGGNSDGVLFSDEFSVYEAEIWSPLTGQFRRAASASIPRNYHSVAVLMKDARVFSGGGGLCGDCDTNHPDAQIYSPSYLFQADNQLAPRPRIASVSGNPQAGESLLVNYRPAADIPVSNFVMVRLGTNTHSVNTDERRIPLGTRQVTQGLQEIFLPDNPNVLLPGNYWLFAIDNNGVPSTGHSLRIKKGVADQSPELEVTYELAGGVTENEPVLLMPTTRGVRYPLAFSSLDIPDGLTVDSDTGAISGTIEQPGTYSLTVLARNNSQAMETSVEINVEADEPVVIPQTNEEPEIVEPEIVEPEVVEPEVVEPEVVEPEVTAPDATAPTAVVPETINPRSEPRVSAGRASIWLLVLLILTNRRLANRRLTNHRSYGKQSLPTARQAPV